MIAKTVIDCLQRSRVPYAVLTHPRSVNTQTIVDRAGVPPECIAKAVMFQDADGYIMAVVPANRHVGVGTLSRKLRRDLSLAQEEGLAAVFTDCARGAIPPLGPEYGIETVMDDALVGQPEIYFEAGDHEELIRVNGEVFLALLRHAHHAQFCR